MEFSSEGSRDPDGEPLTYSWDFDGDGAGDSTDANPTHVYTQPGNHSARLTVTDLSGKTASSTELITVGNTRPTVEIEFPENGLIFDFGDRVPYKVGVTDPEDGAIDCNRVVVHTALAHNEHAHGDQSSTGCEGSFMIPVAWEGESQFIFYVLNISYVDGGGAGGAAPLTGTAETILQPTIRQAEHFTTSSGVAVQDSSDPAGGGGRAIGQLEHGDHVAYAPINLAGIGRLDRRVAPGAFGGTIEARIDSPEGPLVGSVNVPGAGAPQPWTTTSMPVTDPGGAHKLFLEFSNPLVPQNPVLPGSIFSVNSIEFGARAEPGG